MKKRLISLLMTLALCLSLLPFAAVPAGAAWSGESDSSSAKPYQIATAADLLEFAAVVNGTGDCAGRENPAACAVLTADIDMKNETWTPIGKDDDSPYCGVFDGDGHVIVGLNNTGETGTPAYAGLFGNVEGGAVQDVGVIACDLRGETVGGIVGSIENGTVQNCYTTGTLTGTDAGLVTHSAVKNCWSTCALTGRYDAGGVVGYAFGGPQADSTVESCWSAGTVIATGGMGGDGSPGGIVGCNDIGATVKNCCCHADIAPGISPVGKNNGVIGDNVKGLTDAQFRTPASFAGFDTAAWSFTQDGWPRLSAFPVYTLTYDGNDADSGTPPEGNTWQGGDPVAADPGDLEKTDGLFIGWNTAKDGAGTAYKAGDLLTLTENTVLYAQWRAPVTVTTWEDCNKDMQTDGAVRLGGNISPNTNTDASTNNYYDDTPLTVPEGVTVTLDLAGFTVDRQLDIAKRNGCVIRVEGTLIIIDSSAGKTGAITGGWNDGTGDAPNGGGICVGAKGILDLTAGAVTGSKAPVGGGVYIASGGTVNLSGSPQVTGNADDDGTDNVYLQNGQKLHVTGPLTETARLNVSMQTPGVFTQGLKGNGTAANFAGDGAYVAVLTAGGEATLSTTVEISDYTGLMDFARRVNNGETTLCAVLTKDITASGKTWEAIGRDDAHTYTGVFDGDGYVITGLDNSSLESAPVGAGLIGQLGAGGQVRNVGLAGCTLTGTAAGGIVGYSEGAVENCCAVGTVQNRSTALVGFSGGVAGSNHGTVKNCYFSGTVSGNLSAGGVVGYNIGAGTVESCCSTGTVEGTFDAGGVVGSNSSASTVKNCRYNTDIAPDIDPVGYNAGGAVDNVKGLTDAQFRTKANFTGFDRTVWTFTDGCYPRLSAFPVYTLTYDGNGTDSGTVPAGNSWQCGDPAAADPGDLGKTRCTFNGWNTARDGAGTAYAPGDALLLTADTTLYAQWTEQSSHSGGGGSAANSIGLAPGAEAHGKVKIDPPRASAGQKVTVTVTPDEGYRAASLTATDKNGKDVPATQKDAVTWTFTMPDTAVTVTPVFEEITEPDTPDNPDNPGGDVSDRFTDVSRTAWYHDAVQWAADCGLMNGVSDTLFAPNDPCTRAMVVTMVWRMAGSPVVDYLMPYTDVDQNAWYAEAVRWAASAGAVKGTSETTFSPNEPVTREQLAAILYRYAQAQGKGFTGAWMFLLDYPDAADVSEYANEAMHWMVMHGIITGMGDGTLAPKDNATRAQIAAMFMRFCEEMK